MPVTLEEIMDKLEQLGTEQTKRTFVRHGAKEPLFGVKVGDLKKLVKDVKKDQSLARALYDTGNSDAMYLAGLTVDPKTATKDMLRDWARAANWYMLAEYAVAGVAAESPHALELAREWIASGEETVASCGWSAYANYILITPDDRLDLNEIRSLLRRAETGIREAANRVRYTMNGFVIAVGSSVEALHEEALEAARAIGKVDVDMGGTACKVPLAEDYIAKIKAAGKLGAKKKTCIC
ncbi:DNA alkylation repair protein [Cohnella xylanilytica]|uniref:DNA alkylation repair protein n=1 Tax=Cohnella xylanilytica TaxID=557555 RepID=A0A841TYY3_9BACL|nr:DNA alkylation repair protein [Cohnella xylanilytica]MBB6693757.1 DNA alkylation repair protein [Cohnella xylanilytica]